MLRSDEQLNMTGEKTCTFTEKEKRQLSKGRETETEEKRDVVIILYAHAVT